MGVDLNYKFLNLVLFEIFSCVLLLITTTKKELSLNDFFKKTIINLRFI